MLMGDRRRFGFLVAGMVACGAPQKVDGPPTESIQVALQRLCEKLAPREPTVVAVFPLAERGRGATLLGEYVADKLMVALAETGKVKLVERSRLETLRREQMLGVTGELDDTTAASIGNMAGAQAVAVGTLTRVGGRWEVSARLLGATDASVVTLAEATFSDQGVPEGLAGQPLAGSGPAGKSPGPAAKAPAGPRAPAPIPANAVEVLSERSNNTYSWNIGAPYVTTKTVAHGEVAFIPTDNNHFYAKLGTIGEEAGEFRYVAFQVFLLERDAGMVFQAYIDGSWEHRWGFDGRTSYSGAFGWPRRGQNTGLPVGEWVSVKLDLIADLGGVRGQALTGLAFSGNDGKLVYDDVVLLPAE